MEFSRQEYWDGLPFRFPGDPPDPGIKPRSPALQTDSLLTEPPGKPNVSSVCVVFVFFLLLLFLTSETTQGAQPSSL